MSKSESPPVFLSAIPRSGGTLFVTMLDAHPFIAMSYEIYERYLISVEGKPLSPGAICDLLRECKDSDDLNWANNVRDANLRIFLFTARRAGLSVTEIEAEFHKFSETKASFTTRDGRLDFIESLMKIKMRKSGKGFWGGKTEADLYQLHDRHPDASFFIMVRDVRDVYASMLTKGNFRYSATEAAKMWRSRIEHFREFVLQRKPHAMEVVYENLVADPKGTLQSACKVVRIEYSEHMLRFHQKEMTLFENPHGHLSSAQIKQGLNGDSMGRWRTALSKRQIQDIASVVGTL